MGTHKRKIQLDMEALEDMLQLLSEASDDAQQVSRDLQWAIGTFSALKEVAGRCFAQTGDLEMRRAYCQCEEAIENGENTAELIDHVRELIWQVRARNYPQGRLEGMGDGQDTD